MLSEVHVLTLILKKNNDKDPKFKVRDHVRKPNIKTILQKLTHQIRQKFLLLKQLKILYRGHTHNNTNGTSGTK